jgi:hypothetical protein
VEKFSGRGFEPVSRTTNKIRACGLTPGNPRPATAGIGKGASLEWGDAIVFDSNPESDSINFLVFHDPIGVLVHRLNEHSRINPEQMEKCRSNLPVGADDHNQRKLLNFDLASREFSGPVSVQDNDLHSPFTRISHNIHPDPVKSAPRFSESWRGFVTEKGTKLDWKLKIQKRSWDRFQLISS